MEKLIRAKIVFKSKITINNGRKYVNIPKFTRSHCNITEFRKHPRYGWAANSVLFEQVLDRIKVEIFGEDTVLDVSELPPNVSVDLSSFLAVITISV